MKLILGSAQWKKTLLAASLFFVLTGCQTIRRSSAPKPRSNGAPSMSQGSLPEAIPSEMTTENETETSETEPTVDLATPENESRIGLILGPGALRAYAHIGVVQEFVKMKLPIQSVAGIETGALVAAIFANKGLPYDVEWQMMKLKESDLVQKGLLSSRVSAGEVQSLNEFLNMSLGTGRAENSKIYFACPAFQIRQRQTYMMNRGAFTQMLPFCLAFPPLFRPYQQNVAAVMDLRATVDHLRAKGATYIIYVDLLSGANRVEKVGIEDQILWSMAANSLSKQEKGINYVLHVPLQDYDLLDFSHRRQMMQQGQKSGADAAKQIMKKLGL
ncbi:MAG: hypothetical protein COT73_06050 [Bdellovibrio sp. CG10_big_fil_rev_8_21_14_0_10_47_8]|nr:MAG: hypothetical protein COT73_06050 [Bdellovibrio sp. CG10_big_fil_rev_8_21_14_0_10_47_8]